MAPEDDNRSKLMFSLAEPDRSQRFKIKVSALCKFIQLRRGAHGVRRVDIVTIVSAGRRKRIRIIGIIVVAGPQPGH